MGRMHYTSLENIHNVIDLMFLDDLRGEFAQLKTNKQLRVFHDKIAAIKIFDPACGSSNFLTESYLSLRRLENELLNIHRDLNFLPLKSYSHIVKGNALRLDWKELFEGNSEVGNEGSSITSLLL